MNVLPVIVRELRAQARQPFTFNLRVLGVAAVLATLALLALNRGLLPGEGGQAFVFIHDVLLVAIWVLVPLSTADCISRERREGTLGLLFLTPLKARDIVFAKGLAHGLRALTLWLACLPVMVIPFLIGGLTWQISAFSCAVNFSSMALVLGASLLASSFCRQWDRSLALTIALAVFLITAFGGVLFVGIFVAIRPYVPGIAWWGLRGNAPSLELFLFEAFVMMLGAGGVWTKVLSTLSIPAQHDMVVTSGIVTALSLLAAYGLMLLAAWNVRRRWQEQPRSARAEKMERVFCTPVVGRSFFRWWLRRKLERNPIGWLEQRTWSGRVVMWSWLAVLVTFYGPILSFYKTGSHVIENFQGLQVALAALMMASVGITAAGSFRRERETGVLELLLVTPLKSWQIISGRVRGMWGQFALAVALLLSVWLFVGTFDASVNVWSGACLLITFATLPVIGLYYSLAKPNFLSAFLWTLLMGVLFPMFLINTGIIEREILSWMGIPARYQTFQSAGFQVLVWALIQIGLGLVFAWLLHRNLEQRRFALERKS